MRRHVALIIETSSGYGREVLGGIVQFARVHDEWSVFLEQRDLVTKPPSWLVDWAGDGIITRTTTPALLEAVDRTGVPLVNLTDRWDDPCLPLVRSDDEAIGRLAAEHLLERGYERFGFCGFTKEAWSARRQRAFVERVEEAGWPCDVYESAWYGRSVRPWQQERARIAEWLGGIPQPFGVMACNDVRGQQVLDACSNAGLAVPEDVAVIGVDNDELLCRVAMPPLSSVVPNAERVGYRAAEILSRLMAGEPAEADVETIEPVGIATRQSTDVVAIDHPEVAAALHFIRENACRGIQVADVTRNVPISRSTLERRFRQFLGRSPQEEIRRVQVGRARELLTTTNLTIDRIAHVCGFEHPEYLHVVFKRQTDETPGEFRRRSRVDATHWSDGSA